jgi:hypothetical protein
LDEQLLNKSLSIEQVQRLSRERQELIDLITGIEQSLSDSSDLSQRDLETTTKMSTMTYEQLLETIQKKKDLIDTKNKQKELLKTEIYQLNIEICDLEEKLKITTPTPPTATTTSPPIAKTTTSRPPTAPPIAKTTTSRPTTATPPFGNRPSFGQTTIRPNTRPNTRPPTASRPTTAPKKGGGLENDNSDNTFYLKYIKYKAKYLKLKKVLDI